MQEMEDMNDNRISELRDGDSVMTEGADISKLDVPAWYDAEKFNRAKKVYKDYFASVNFSHLCGLLLSFYFTKNIKTLRSTGESETVNTLFHRYLATVRNIQKWYEGDIWDPKDPAHKSLAMVRGMHARVAKRMASLKDGVVYVSQWDMAVTQWAFVGPIVLFRDKVGLHSCTDDDYYSLIHFWRVIGYMLGIEDQYNLCDGDYQKVLDVCNKMLVEDYRPKVQEASYESVSMGENVISAMQKIDQLLTWRSIGSYIHELVDVPAPFKMNLYDRMCNYFMRSMMLQLIRFDSVRLSFNDFYRHRLDLADKLDLKLMAESKNSKSKMAKSSDNLLSILNKFPKTGLILAAVLTSVYYRVFGTEWIY